MILLLQSGMEQFLMEVNNKYLMTGPKGQQYVLFPRWSRGEAKGNTRGTNSLCPMGPVMRCFEISPNSRTEGRTPHDSNNNNAICFEKKNTKLVEN